MKLRALAMDAAVKHIAGSHDPPSPEHFSSLPVRSVLHLLNQLYATGALKPHLLSALAHCPPSPLSTPLCLDLSPYASVVMDHWIPHIAALPFSHLNLSNCSRLTEEAIFSLLDQPAPASSASPPHMGCSLFPPLRDDGLSVLARTLVSINISNIPDAVTPASVEALAALPNLADIKLTNNSPALTNVVIATLASCARHSGRDGQHPLRKLDISECSKISGAGLAALAESASHLEFLDLSGATKITGQALAPLRELNQMRSLKMRKCIRLTNEALVHISHGMPKLLVLDLCDCPKISDNGLVYLQDNTNLEFLCLAGTGVTGAAFQRENGREPMKWWASLQTLDISRCNEMTEDGLASMFKAMGCVETSFKALTARHILVMTADALSHLAMGVPNLEKLDLSDCRGIEYHSFCLLAACGRLNGFGRKLTHLNLSGTFVSDDALARLLGVLPKLESLAVAKCFTLGYATLSALAASEAKLNSIDISGCRMDAVQTSEMLAGQNDSLVNLVLGDISFGARIPSIIAPLIDIELLSLRGMQCTESVLRSVAILPRLRVLCLQDMSPDPDECTKEWSFSSLLPATGLVELDVSRCELVSDSACLMSFRHLTSLQSLNLGQCHKVTDVGVLAVVADLTELRSLNIRGCACVSSEAVSDLLFDLVDEPRWDGKVHALTNNSEGLKMEELKSRGRDSATSDTHRQTSAASSSSVGTKISLGGGSFTEAIYSPFGNAGVSVESISNIWLLEEQQGGMSHGTGSTVGTSASSGRRRRRRRRTY